MSHPSAAAWVRFGARGGVLSADSGNLANEDVQQFQEIGVDHNREATEPGIQEWVDTLVSICLSLEIKELLERLEKEDHAFPQTVIQKEED